MNFILQNILDRTEVKFKNFIIVDTLKYNNRGGYM